MIHRLIGSIILITLSITVSAQERKVDWVLETVSSSWQARDSQGEVVYNNHLWIFGGWFSSQQSAPRDVWKSADGINWNLVTKEAPWIHSDLPMSIVFKDKMWMMGGWYNGRLEGHGAGNEVWSSDDGVKWVLETKAAAWSPRAAGALVVLKGKMWILGGIGNYFFSKGDETLTNDVWYSSDGKDWKLATANAGWSPRAFHVVWKERHEHSAYVFKDKIWVTGGLVPPLQNDVWSLKLPTNW